MDPQQVLTISRDGLFTLITVVAPLMLVVPADSPWKTMGDLVAAGVAHGVLM